MSSSSGSRGGGEIYLLRLAEGLRAKGCRIDVVMSTAERMDELADAIAPLATVHRLPLTGTYERTLRGIAAAADVAQHRRMALWIEVLQPDVVHVNQQVAEDGLDLLLAARRSGRPYLSTIHITHSASSLSARYGALRDRVTRRVLAHSAARHIVVARHAKSTLAEWVNGSIAARTQVVWNGAYALSVTPDRSQRSALRADWGASDTDIVMAGVGRLEPQKQPLRALEITESLQSRGLPVRLVWIGDGPLRGDMERAAARSGQGKALYLDGWRHDVKLRLPACDIFLMPSHFEGLPFALLEAMWAGLPSIVSGVDGMPEAITDGIDELVCRQTDLATWCDVAHRLASDADLRRRLGEAAAKTARDRFSIEAMTAGTMEVYRAAIADRTANLTGASA